GFQRGPEPERPPSGSASEPCVRVSNSHGSSITWRLSYAPLLDGLFLWPSLPRGSGGGAVLGCGFLTFLPVCARSPDPLSPRLLREICGWILRISLVAFGADWLPGEALSDDSRVAYSNRASLHRKGCALPPPSRNTDNVFHRVGAVARHCAVTEIAGLRSRASTCARSSLCSYCDDVASPRHRA